MVSIRSYVAVFTALGLVLGITVHHLLPIVSGNSSNHQLVPPPPLLGRSSPSTVVAALSNNKVPPVESLVSVVSQAAVQVMANISLGYASGRNQQRWAIIAPAVVRTFLTSIGRASDENRSIPAEVVAIDYGADQGFFSAALAQAARLSLERVMPAKLRILTNGECAVGKHNLATLADAQRFATGRNCTANRLVSVLAVEKGGVGGSLWKKKSTLDVHSRLREVADRLAVRSSLSICAAAITASSLAEQLRRGCSVSVQLVLSMLHWVEGVDSRDDFAKVIGVLARQAALTVLELPHPAARNTYGEHRYRKWYSGPGWSGNVTQLLSAAVELHCPRSCRVVLLGRTPWGRGLHRELHAIYNVDLLPPCGDCCKSALGCNQLGMN